MQQQQQRKKRAAPSEQTDKQQRQQPQSDGSNKRACPRKKELTYWVYLISLCDVARKPKVVLLKVDSRIQCDTVPLLWEGSTHVAGELISKQPETSARILVLDAYNAKIGRLTSGYIAMPRVKIIAGTKAATNLKWLCDAGNMSFSTSERFKTDWYGTKFLWAGMEKAVEKFMKDPLGFKTSKYQKDYDEWKQMMEEMPDKPPEENPGY